MTTIQIKVPNWLDFLCAWPVMVYRKWKYGYSFRRIYLDEGYWSIVDSADYYRFGGFKWCVEGDKGKFYAIRGVKIRDDKIKLVRLHREIMNAPAGIFVDHRNSNSLDNRRGNLRLATRSQNMQNMRKRKNTTSRFIGAYLYKKTGQWVACITHEGERIWIGYFDIEIEAARAYDRAAIKYHGEFARLNFPREDYVNETLPPNSK
jgi:hypothetical protein